MVDIGTLEELKDIRELWKHEQYDFSKWLTSNIHYIGDILGLTLVDVSAEEKVGQYRCDITAKDESTKQVVVIENQLEGSNHDHLGKIITYASRLDATHVVWVVTEAKAEHRSAIEWLNEHTDENVNFFLLELHAYRIGNSPYAPRFEIIEQPNDYKKSVKTNNQGGEVERASRTSRFEFWTKFNDVISRRNKPFAQRKPGTDHWYDVAIGTSKAHVAVTLVNKDGYVGVELYIADDKELFDSLQEYQDEISKRFEFDLEWLRLNGKCSRIKSKIFGLDFEKQDNYEELMNTAIDRAVKMRDVFREYISKLGYKLS